ncbi:PLP-dependent aminotransferase family protein [Nitratireductor sp. ZSWI3]|uniref:aminotransferase-like domain-containing protein n=1 Tax=Nitratireductor sp. ZSWI3 TaxID=2966359 RepID=UPI00214F708B|nr:PLP-dependent aminotransferase family protein [Nitratireductor sp. ZSWI3]MCR4265232.1 PLP-dependent aminotransferase family protein [Nitratireductor sp. ZSWI3]
MSAQSDRQWLPDLREGGGPLYLRIAEALAEARANGLLQPGDRLPPQRELAQRLGVDLTTITRAFTEARRRNLIDAAPGRGTFVTPGAAEEPILDLSMNIPPAPAGVNLPALIKSGIDGLLKRSSAEALLSYHPGPGSPVERAAGSLWLERAGPRLPIGRVAVGAGAQSLLAAVMMTATRDAETVLADRLTYPGFIALAKAMNRRPAAVGADEHGMRPDRLEEAASRHGARLVYLNPTLHNPTTLVMPEHRRCDLIDVARRMGLTLIEDDPYSPLLPRPVPSFLALAPEITIHIATLAKCISPFLRTAFLAVPDGAALENVARHLRSLTLMAPPLMTGLAAEWIRDGTAQEIARGVRREAEARQVLAGGILPSVATHGSGFHVWMPLDEGQSAAAIVEKAQRRGLAVSGAAEFAIDGDAPEAVRIALGAVQDRRKLSEALQSLTAILGSSTAPEGALV